MNKNYVIFLSLFFMLWLLSSPGLYAQGNLWGMTQNGGSSGIGVIYSTNADATGYAVRYTFPTACPGANPMYTKLVMLPDGRMFGMTSNGGVYDKGTIFEFDPVTNTYTKRFDFKGTTGYNPLGSLIYGANGKLYGLTRVDGGDAQGGTLFEFDPVTYVHTTKFVFGGIMGSFPRGSLIQASNGNLYGMTSEGGLNGNSRGVLFEYNPTTDIYTKKFEFSTITGTGISPHGDLTETAPGKLYGMTSAGGTNGLGTIFEYDLNASVTDPVTNEITFGIFTKKFDFTAASGNTPYGSMTYANQKLYGLTYAGGNNGSGVLFEFDPVTAAYTKKVDLDYAVSGANPYGSLALISNNKLYGLTNAGGANGTGAIIEYDPATGIFIRKGNFPAAGDGWRSGAHPMGTLAEAANGKLYGLTFDAGMGDSGVLFEFVPTTGAYTKKLDLNYSPSGTSHSTLVSDNATLTQSSANGRIYGVTEYGGANGLGVLFEFNPATFVYTKKIDFSQTNGNRPATRLVEAFNGKLYGITSGGALFEYTPTTNTYVKKVDFSSGPLAGLIDKDNLVFAANGKLYGATLSGGANGTGIVFEYDPSTGGCIKKIDLGPAATSGSGISHLMQAANGKLYGYIGGSPDQGALIEIDLIANSISRKVEFDGLNGNAAYFNYGTLMEHAPGKLLGVTTFGGSINLGVLFEYDYNTNTFLKKADFPDYPYPNRPFGLVQSSDGNIYGNARQDLFQYDTAAAAIIHKFSFVFPTGELPSGVLLAEKPNVSVGVPANGAINQNVTVTVIAKALTDATTYTIELNDSPLFTGNSIVKSGARSQSFSGLSYNTQYYTRVKTDLSPVWGATTTFTTASPEYFAYVDTPVSGATNQNVNLTVTANAIIAAATYTIELNTASDFTGTSIVRTGVRSQTFNNLALSTTYYTRVKTDLSPNWGVVRSFTTGSAVSLSYVTSPANNGINLSWAPNVTANTITGAATYTIELSPVSDFSSDIIQRSGSTPVLAFTGLLYNTLYYSRVTTDLSPGTWGPIRSFTTGSPVSFAYVTNPADGATNVATTVNVFSNTVPGAASYTIELNTASDFTGTPIVKTGASRASQFTGLASGTTYYTRVSTDLSAGVWGATRSFTTLASARVNQYTEALAEVSKEPFSIRVFGNPFHQTLRFTIEDPITEDAVVKLIDLTGRVFHQSEHETNSMIEIQESVAPGIYLLQVRTPSVVRAVRVIKVE